ncbi:DNA-processing protein DprA [Tsukamurella sp. 8F]|uniref:DNA-processing protein DprA n=1 Tax=unclassified Tsukamurella TaxID=2633480 RepID=UPI0023BA0CC5|nr:MULTISPECIES: DNA-processing protein DprA [unclassified Tsukamurella]MDF0529587.1 DNA-processing protein DprA [Tsukamurella sp. 8J]MDF0585725.1 DNA-processing protein DprA [Tsukamurella sp. 8F]
MTTTAETLRALTAFEHYGSPARAARALVDPDPALLRDAWKALSGESRQSLKAEAADLDARGIYAVNAGSSQFPESLMIGTRPVVPTLFCHGDIALLTAPGAGMCGSRRVSDLGLRAARACGVEVSERGLTVVSGYARGVDTATHLAALDNGGQTVIVLAEGINSFKVKSEFSRSFDPARVLVVSQFRPTQPWAAYAAMARNHVIFGLGKALVVIEAGDRGGTLAAGRDALKRGRPVFALNFGADTPVGNRLLIDAGARAITSRTELGHALDRIQPESRQETLL